MVASLIVTSLMVVRRSFLLLKYYLASFRLSQTEERSGGWSGNQKLTGTFDSHFFIRLLFFKIPSFKHELVYKSWVELFVWDFLRL